MQSRTFRPLGRATLAFAGLAALFAAAPSAAQPYPNKPITLVVVFAPGGTADLVGRAIAAGITQQLGQQVVVDNKPGAGGTLGANAVARAKPDGYTMLQLVSTHTIGETYLKTRPYDLQKDFAPISNVGTSPYWVLVNPEQNKAQNIQDLVGQIRAKPGKFNYASGGAGALAHLATEMFKQQGNLDMVHIPFKGNGPALTELMAGRADLLFDQPASSEAFVKAGKLKPLAVTALQRLPNYPDIPTMNESGFPGFEAVSFLGLAFPAGTPQNIIDTMNKAVNQALAAPELRQRLEGAGITPAPTTVAAFNDRIKAEIALWRKVITDAKIQPE